MHGPGVANCAQAIAGLCTAAAARWQAGMAQLRDGLCPLAAWLGGKTHRGVEKTYRR